MGETQRGEAILRNLAQELLTDLEYRKFKHAVNSFQQTKSVPTLCHQLRPVINTTEKLLLLVELCSRIPRGLREDFHRICSIQFPNYETYLRIYSNDNAMTEIPKVIAQDSSGKFQIVSNGSEKKILVNYNGYKNGDLISQHGTSVTSGVYSENDDLTSLKQVGNDKEDDVFVWTPQYGRIDSSKSAFVTRDSYDGAIRRVFIARRDDGSLGLGIVGGREYGTDIIVSVVDPEGPAAEQGVRAGDRILEVNGTDFLQMSHAEAVTLMRNAWNVIMKVQSASSYRQNDHPSRVQVREIELIVYPGADGRLGCSTNSVLMENKKSDNVKRQNRVRYLAVKDVDQNSPAQKAGIVVGDYITKIDGIDIRALTEKQITSLTRSKRLIVCVKRVLQDDGTGQLVPLGMNHLRNFSEEFSPESSSSPVSKKFNNSFGSDSTNKDPDDNPLDFSASDYDPIQHVYKSPSQLHLATEPEKTSHHRRPSLHDSTNNWLLSPKGQAARKYFEKLSFITTPNVAGGHPHSRSRSADSLGTQFERRGRAVQRNVSPVPWGRNAARYVRSRSQSPHPLKKHQRMSRRDQDMMTALQMGMEKRQRAIRLSLYQTSPPSDDFNWDM
nr:tyrosine-protein phosphatase non-receptor type 13-like isoform X4 [Crassostrea virginica]XP_022297738.1 tyrosine-protein phosphatase non-receptor type 13-like isoform X4 [Crassostrea virginica]XP_022297739.1 tyrosine-protein phosphatase non-receptor type 13-like isoform X4 [Crassostrea virginica]XP_022297740.1 tyrosine-protein phosphatase non-receptor type 13-like isoform X4 [Crassostrea virginica]XP_022297741.1 tyrosine-protein phosphatase non-receptor type 13-like isoform X4 [Crassostrea v